MLGGRGRDCQHSHNPTSVKSKPPWCLLKSPWIHISSFILCSRDLHCPEVFFLKLVPLPGIFIASLESSRTILTNPSTYERSCNVVSPNYMKKKCRSWKLMNKISGNPGSLVPVAGTDSSDFVSSQPSASPFTCMAQLLLNLSFVFKTKLLYGVWSHDEHLLMSLYPKK